MKKLIILFLICVLTLPVTVIYAAPIHSYEETITISDSITLTKVNEFYSDHNLTYSIIKADLSNENTSLKLLTPQLGIDTLATVSNLAKTDDSTVAALNADFFSTFGSKAFAIGIEIKDGDLLQSPINPGTMATVSLENDILSMSYLDFHIMAVAPNWQYNEIRHLNKHTSYYGDILMYTSEFNGGYSPAPGGEVLEVVVEDGKIKEFRRKMPSVKIPENGCVLVVSEGANMFFANNFNIGDEIRFDYYITPDLSNAETAFGGGAMLVSEGKALTGFSHNISGYNPRSAIGIDKSGTTVYLVAVDGRQSSSRGMTMSELAKLMASLGCYTAVNLDGGGSTNMVASTIWDEELHTVNSPTENRRVINAVGITYGSDNPEPASIAVKSDRDVVFIGDSVTLGASVLNKDKRPVSGDVTWSSAYGNVYGNVFSPTVGGTVTAEATYQNVTASKEIYVIDKIQGIKLTNYISLKQGASQSLGIVVFDSEGRNVAVENTEPFEITSSNPSVATVSGQTVTALGNGNAVITVKKDNATSYCSVNVGGSPNSVTDTFDTLGGNFISYPSYVEGSVELSREKSSSNGKSIQLCYDFSNESSDSKAAYYALSPKIKLDDSCNEISLKVCSSGAFDHSVRAQFTNGKGEIFRVKMSGNPTAESWVTMSAIIPKDTPRPVTLDRIYALYTDGEKKDVGCIYLDDLTYTTSSGNTIKYIAAPMNAYDTPKFAPSSKVFRIGALSKGQKTLLTSLINTKLTTKVSEVQSGVILGNLKAFGQKEDASALYITLNTSKGGIKATDSSQWNNLANAIAKTTRKNVFILSDNSIFGNDALENNVIIDYLASIDKNVFVITSGERNTYENRNGVSYFTIANTDKDALSLTKVQNYAYLEFSLDNTPTFQWKSLVE